jgi:hypothetical protein
MNVMNVMPLCLLISIWYGMTAVNHVQDADYMFTDTFYTDKWAAEEDYVFDMKKGELSHNHFIVLGVYPNKDDFITAQNKIGKSTIYRQSETSESGPKQICYKSSYSNDYTIVVFGTDHVKSRISEVILGDSRGNNDPNIKYCVSTSHVGKGMTTTRSGIKLGITLARLNKIIGKEPKHSHGVYEYLYNSIKPLKKSNFYQVYPDGVSYEDVITADKEAHCPSEYEIIQMIHARFEDDKLKWIFFDEFTHPYYSCGE